MKYSWIKKQKNLNVGLCTVRTLIVRFDVRWWSRQSRDPEEGPTFWVLGRGVPEKALRFWISRRPERHRSSRSSLSSANQPFHFEYLKNNKNASKLNYQDGGWPIIQINVKIWQSKFMVVKETIRLIRKTILNF